MGYRDFRERVAGNVLDGIRNDEDFSSSIRNNYDIIINNAAYLFEVICSEYEFRRTKPLWRRTLHGAQHLWGQSIFAPLLLGAGLIRPAEQTTLRYPPYEPTEKGLEIYHRQVEAAKISA